jgi:hypothetical protein
MNSQEIPEKVAAAPITLTTSQFGMGVDRGGAENDRKHRLWKVMGFRRDRADVI